MLCNAGKVVAMCAQQALYEVGLIRCSHQHSSKFWFKSCHRSKFNASKSRGKYGNLQGLDEAKHLSPMNGTCRDTEVHSVQTSYLKMKILQAAEDI